MARRRTRRATVTRSNRQATVTRSNKQATVTRSNRQATVTRSNRQATVTRSNRQATVTRSNREPIVTRSRRQATENLSQVVSENTNVNDVDTLLSCIDIWRKNSRRSRRQADTNVMNQEGVSTNEINDEERVKNIVKDLLSMTKLMSEIPEDVLIGKPSEKKSMDKKTLMAGENFPMELSDEEDLPEHLRTKVPKQGSIDTRFASESSDENNGEFKFLSHLSKDPDVSTLQMVDKQGNNVVFKPFDSREERIVLRAHNIKNLDGLNFKSLDNEIPDPEELLKVDERINYDAVLPYLRAKEDSYATIEESGLEVQTERKVFELRPKKSKGKKTEGEGGSGGEGNEQLEVELSYLEEDDMDEDGVQSGTKVNGRSSRTRRNTNRNPLPEQVVDIRNMDLEKIRGVCYCKSDNSWTAWWTEKGKSRKKAFKLSIYGFEGARRLAIEHRMLMEELLPELKEKKTKVNKRKTSEALGPKTTKKSPGKSSRNITRAGSNTLAAIVPFMEDGIYRGTRNRSRQNQTYAHLHNQDAIVYINDNANLNQTEGKRFNENCKEDEEANFLQYKRRRTTCYQPGICRIEEIEYFHELEGVFERIKRRLKDRNTGVCFPDSLKHVKPLSEKLQILPHTDHPQENALDTAQNKETAEENKVASVHYRIKLEKSTLEEVQNAIKKALDELPNKKNTNENGSDNTATQQDTQNPQSAGAENDYVDVEAVSIAPTDGTNRPKYNIVPTYVKRSDGDEVLAFVVLNQ